MTADEARKISNENRESYIAGLLSHYLKLLDGQIKANANVGKNKTRTTIPPTHYDDTIKPLTKELRKLGFKVRSVKKDHRLDISWEEEVK